MERRDSRRVGKQPLTDPQKLGTKEDWIDKVHNVRLEAQQRIDDVWRRKIEFQLWVEEERKSQLCAVDWKPFVFPLCQIMQCTYSYNSIVWSNNDSLVSLASQVGQQTRQGAGDAVELGELVALVLVGHDRRHTKFSVCERNHTNDKPVTIATLIFPFDSDV